MAQPKNQVPPKDKKSTAPKTNFDYKDAGVDIQAGDDLVDWLVEFNSRFRARPENIKTGIGGFASIYRLPFEKIHKPCLVSSTDGVGTKLKYAEIFNSYEEIAQDLVGMCVNDLVCTGATPLYFLDYFATGKLDKAKAQLFLKGLFKALYKCKCDLIGGETAEMPGVYAPGDFDCAGFVTGIVDEDHILGSHRVKVGDAILGLPSSGFHSNGFSLIRRAFERDFQDHRELLIEPTRLYAPVISEALEKGIQIHALAHITGGGVSNLPRILPRGTQAALESWEIPDPFREVQRRSGISDRELYQVLNCGIGMMVILPREEIEKFESLTFHEKSPLILGQIAAYEGGEPRVALGGMVFE